MANRFTCSGQLHSNWLFSLLLLLAFNMAAGYPVTPAVRYIHPVGIACNYRQANDRLQTATAYHAITPAPASVSKSFHDYTFFLRCFQQQVILRIKTAAAVCKASKTPRLYHPATKSFPPTDNELPFAD